MERSRPALPTEETAPLPAGDAAPLRLLLEEVRAPRAKRADVDLLVRRLSGPLADGESTRERADVLLEMLNDAELRDVEDSDDRPVRAAALDALLALGHPYSLEVPPDVLAELRPPKTDPHIPDRTRFFAGVALTLAVTLVQGGLVSSASKQPGAFTLALILYVLIGATSLLPLVLAVTGLLWHSRWLNRLGTWALGGVGVFSIGWFVQALPDSLRPNGFLALASGLAQVGSAVLLTLPKDGE